MKLLAKGNTKIINNAADLNEIGVNKEITERYSYKNTLLCPPSSILDGMATCSYNMAYSTGRDKNLVPGSMYFRLSSPSFFYDGYSNLHKDENTIDIGFSGGYTNNANGEMRFGPVIKQTKLATADILVAINVFKDVCNALCSIYKEMEGIDLGDIAERKKIYEEILLNRGHFINIIKLSALKNIGDLFQQINMIMKNGGFESPYPKKFDLAEENTIIGTNNDRPAAVFGMIAAIEAQNKEALRKNFAIGYLHAASSVFYFSKPLTVGLKGGKKTKKRITKKKKKKTRKHRYTK